MLLAKHLASSSLCTWLICTMLQLDPSWVLRVKDGDTFVLRNAGISNTEDVRVCLTIARNVAQCVNTPESNEPGFTEATRFTDAWLQEGPFDLFFCKRDSFGRFLGQVTRRDANLGQALLDHGHATMYKRTR